MTVNNLTLQQRRDFEIGEENYRRSVLYGKQAADSLFKAQWSYGAPEWYDHRLHWLDPEHHFTDFFTMSADNVIRVLPLGGRILDLCSGDGFYAYYWWRLRASFICCVDKNEEAYHFAKSHYSHERIEYLCADVLNFDGNYEYYDVVVIRGAIEHFLPEAQQRIFAMAYSALKHGGYFCGDTPAANPNQEKLLDSHEHEWKDEAEMREALSHTFSEIETFSLESATDLHAHTKNGTPGKRTTLFWRCRK